MRMRGYQEAPGVHEPKNMKMWWCEDTNKHTEYMSLRTKGYEDTRLQASTHEPEDMGMQGCEDTSKYTQTLGYKDARMQGYKQVHRNLRIWGYGDVKI